MIYSNSVYIFYIYTIINVESLKISYLPKSYKNDDLWLVDDVKCFYIDILILYILMANLFALHILIYVSLLMYVSVDVNLIFWCVFLTHQLMDKTSLHLPEKSLALEIVKFYTDLNMQRSFFSSILPFKPDVILFLGDYFDGGPYLSDEE